MNSRDNVPEDAGQVAPPVPKKEGDVLTLPRPPMQQKFVTERPQPKERTDLGPQLERAGSVGEKLPQLDRQARLTFDPYSSDSSSSSDEDEEASTHTAERRGSTARRKSNAGPFSRLKINNEHFNTKGRVSKKDGRLRLSINETMNSGYFAKTLGAGIRKTFKGVDSDSESLSSSSKENERDSRIAEIDELMEDPKQRVRLNIVVIVIGSRGDIQPFLRIGKILKENYNHRVRIATHPAFKSFVENDSGLEFFSIGGDPSELMAFMVKNPGLIPNLETVREGEIGKRRAAMMEMFEGMWRACVNSKDDEVDKANLKMMGERIPFVADAIIANPPSFAPPHIAERLGVPLHMMFTFPYSPTTSFPHPLANIKTTNVSTPYTNFMSYPLVEMMTWQGLGDLINRFRQKTLMLEEVSTLWAPGQLYRLKVPYTYMWSPGLVPKPKDWSSEISVTGFVFLDLASSFEPPDDLAKFLDAGPPPVYIGFGSIVVDDPDEFTKLIYRAVQIAGVRALVSKGWGGFGSNESCPENIFMLDNTPHDWLFPKVSAVVHHGGAGTTAIGLKCAKPTMIVPFFGDQPFWGDMVSKAKAGAHECIPYKKLTAERLAEGMKQCLTEEANANVKKIAESIEKEGDGALNAVKSFHRSLPLRSDESLRCSLLPNHGAAWRLKNTSLRLSPLAAELLVEWRKTKWSELRLLRHFEWNDFGGPGEPVTGVWGAVVDTLGDVATGVGLVPVNMAKSVKKREKYYEKRFRLKKRDKKRRQQLKNAKNGPVDEHEHNNINGRMQNGTTKEEEVENEEVKATKETNGNANGRPNAPNRAESRLSQISEPEDWLAEEFAQEAGHGFHKTLSAVIKSPMLVSLALTQGFHNAPRLYGDETVRPPPRVTGFHSGIRAGRDEMVYGVRDGVTGLWTQPYRMAKLQGVLGFARGVGFGIGGLVLKDIAAFFGPGAYFLKGLEEEYHKKDKPTAFLRRSRIMQGHRELQELEPRQIPSDPEHDIDDRKEERSAIEKRVGEGWKKMQPVIKAEKKGARKGITAALLGQPHRKDGQRIEMRSAEGDGDGGAIAGVSKTRSAPLNRTEALHETKNHGTTNTNGHFNDTTNANANALHKSPSDPQRHAPGKENQHWHRKHGHHRHHQFEPMEKFERNEAKEKALPALPKDAVPGVFKASLEGNGEPVRGKSVEGVEMGVRAEGLGL
ncbi:UDP-Glycosyltransferase/glycogen phosphorylase [Byssothecium circinans]|uniref:UDP-Glycosyltransferase/glycogen phosphorylase n=1 Tax=Byssothecium circinans TaxID=147558 RepID=A0A6A5UAM9_9PLEO|nr:UDP-Glycosyltransferase/glycogen phosphorylase [Byssothecium circinans]